MTSLFNNKNVFIILAFIIFSIGFILSPSPTYAQKITDCDENMLLKDCLEQIEEQETNETPQVEPERDSGRSFFMNFIRMIFALLLILALIYVMVKILGRKNRTLHQTNVLENLGGIPLGHNKSIQLIRIGERVIAVGVGENVELLFEISDEKVIQLLQESSKASTSENNIFQFITERMKKIEKKDNDSNMFKKMFANELDKMKENRNKIIQEHEKRDDLNE